MVLIESAFRLARELHADQMRKGTSIPYLSHLLGVASLVMEDGQDDHVVAAALLHDAAEDHGGLATVGLIRERISDAVADLVVECSDSLTADPEAKAPWRERKQAALDAIPHRSIGALHIIAADKLHNVRAMVTDAAIGGPTLWGRFNASAADILWYHEAMAADLGFRIPESRSVHLLIEANSDLRDAVQHADPAAR